MAVLLAESVDKSFADRTVLRGATLSVDAGEHVGLIGTNGSGKSTLLSILSGAMDPDRGRLVRTGRIALLTQDPQFPGCVTVEDVVREALAWHRDLLRDWNVATEKGDLRAQERIQAELDTRGWEVDHKIDAVLGRIGAPARTAGLDRLSGGERRRLALAAALLQDADVLLLDEPTNHLDAEAVEWLESWLTGFRGAVLLVTHDRYLLEAVAERIVEVERGELVSYDGSYGDYVVAHAEREARLTQHRDRLLRTIATEAAWAARSPSARTVKQKARLQRLDALRDTVPELKDTSLSFAFKTGVPRGVTLVEMRGLRKGYGDRVLFSGVDEVLRPGDRVAVLGPNGAGKSTLLRTLTGEVTPDRGEIAKGPRVKIGVLDQARTGLDPSTTVFEAAGDDQDHIIVGGNSIHVATFLGRFAFPRESFGQRVAALSGGERARLLLAKLMLQGANVLLLDEPTNDLDLLTLRTLEEALLGFDGALLVISHDRAFVDRVSTRVVAFEGDGKVVGYASRQQWMAARAAVPAPVKSAAPKPVAPPPPAKRDKLSFKEQKELAELPARIEAAEADKRELEAVLADPATYKSRTAEVAELSTRLEALTAQVDALYARWEELEKRA